MGTIEVIKKFIESSALIERSVTEVLERLPERLRYGISYGPTFRYWLGFLRQSEGWDRRRLEEYQFEALRAVLLHAARHVPYYRRLFLEVGFNPKHMQSAGDITVLPYLDRKMVKDHHRELLADNIPRRRLIPAMTSGTSGMPLTVYGTKDTEEKHWATIVNLWSRIGYSPRARTVFFESNVRAGQRGDQPWRRYSRRLVLSMNYLIEPWIERFAEIINDFRPEFIVGFPHTVAAFSSYLKKSGRMPCDGLKGILVYAEAVHDWQKEIIHEVWGVRVFADYGMVEKVIHGGACEHTDAYHLYPQYGLTEYMPLQDQGHELVGTGFINDVMPLIRYRTGDVASGLSTGCHYCGRQYDSLSRIGGRISDFLVDGEGRIVSLYLTIDPQVFDCVERFQLFQDSPGMVEVRLWPAKGFRDENGAALVKEIQKCTGLLGRNIRYMLVVVKDSNHDGLKKYRMVEQHLDMKTFLW